MQLCQQVGKGGIQIQQSPGLAPCVDYFHPVQVQVGFNPWPVDLGGNLLEITTGYPLVEHNDRFHGHPTLPGIDLIGQVSQQSALTTNVVSTLDTGTGIQDQSQLSRRRHP
jgi:hypothetical protein